MNLLDVEFLIVLSVMVLFFKNQEVAVIGGGNSALEEAMYLATLCKKYI